MQHPLAERGKEKQRREVWRSGATTCNADVYISSRFRAEQLVHTRVIVENILWVTYVCLTRVDYAKGNLIRRKCTNDHINVESLRIQSTTSRLFIVIAYRNIMDQLLTYGAWA